MAATFRLLAATALLLTWLTACTPGQTGTPPSFTETPVSLLYVTPMVGGEKFTRDNPPQPERIMVDEEAVSGWISPSEGVLSFPVKLREGAHLSFRLGANSGEMIPAVGDLVARVEFEPLGNQSESQLLFEEDLMGGTYWLNKWNDVNITIGISEPTDGFLIFTIEGRLAGDSDTPVLWGQPSVYYPDERRHRNILLIGIDTLRRDALDIYSGRSEVSPNLRGLAESGTVFTRAWSQAPFTVPSFASMITGRYPADLSVTLAFDTLPDAATTIAETLLPEGIATGTICGNTYLGNDNSGFHQGNECLWHRLNATPSDSVDKAIEFMDRSNDRDFFLFLHIMDPHGPYDPPQEYIDLLCDPDYQGKYRTAFEDGLDWQLTPVIPAENEIRQVRGLYDAEAADVDNAMGRLFEYLESTGLIEDTLVIFAADHGEEFFEHGGFEHGQSLYEEMVHLPLIVWGDGFTDVGAVDAPVGNIDIGPSIYRHLGLPVPGQFPGTPLQDTVGGDSAERIIFGEGNLRRGSHQKFAVEWPWKCIIDYFTGETELYNLETDPDEREDRSETYPEIAERLAGLSTLAMLPIQTVYVLALMGDNEGGPDRFTGTITVPEGIAFATVSGFIEDDDQWSQDGNTITFDLSSQIDLDIKAIVLVPAAIESAIDVSLLSDGRVSPDRFFPYASEQPEMSGTATVNVWDLTWPNRITPNALTNPVAAYVLAIPGFPRDESGSFTPNELDAETMEQLNALGYIR